jgi:hypothetical protein
LPVSRELLAAFVTSVMIYGGDDDDDDHDVYDDLALQEFLSAFITEVGEPQDFHSGHHEWY